MADLTINLLADRDVDEIYETLAASGGSSAAEAFARDLDALYSVIAHPFRELMFGLGSAGRRG